MISLLSTEWEILPGSYKIKSDHEQLQANSDIKYLAPHQL